MLSDVSNKGRMDHSHQIGIGLIVGALTLYEPRSVNAAKSPVSSIAISNTTDPEHLCQR